MNFDRLFRKKTADVILKQAQDAHLQEHQLHKNLGVRDLTAFGIAAIVGAGIFSTIGEASYHGGPAVSLLFIFTAVACGFSAMCYAEFASRIPLSGSAYTYAYASFGELIAWIIGWDLVMEYAIGNVAVAISWSDYFTSLLQDGFHLHIPEYLCVDVFSAHRLHTQATDLMTQGTAFADLTRSMREAWTAYETAPRLGGITLIADIPAFIIVILITWLVYVGIRESKRAGNIMVLLKLAIVLSVIAIGAFYVDTDNWSPFAPNGLAGVMKGVSGVFFAYIGFDAISTTAEECKNPKRDLPRSIFYSLIICTVLYIAISLVLTGMVPFTNLKVGDPLSFAFKVKGFENIATVIGISAVIAIAGVLLVYQMGQPRIWMSMSRDGLLPRRFGKIHPKYKTPAFATIITGIIVSIPTLFLNLTEVTELTSIGTLFAFVLVCAGVLRMEETGAADKSRYKVPYVNGKFIVPGLLVLIIGLLLFFSPGIFSSFFSMTNPTPEEPKTGWEIFSAKIPMIIFAIICLYVVFITMKKSLSLIPVLGLLSNLYLMAELGYTNWLRFLIWLVVGLVIYFGYSYKNSRLANAEVKL